MPTEEQSSTRSHQSLPQGGGVDLSLDELAKGLATGAVSRGKALRWMGGALVGAALAAIPGVAFANDCRRLGRECRRDSQCCSRNCIRRGDDKVCGCPQGQSRCNDRCVNLQRSERHCGSCSNRCAEGKECVDGVCQGGCPNGSTLCGGACVSKLCPQGQAFNPSTCRCGPCPPGTTICTSGTLPGLNVCCPLEGHIACCGGDIVDQTSGAVQAHIIGCVNSSCPGGCVISSTGVSPDAVLEGDAEVCLTCGPCVTDTGVLGCLSEGGTPVCVPL